MDITIEPWKKLIIHEIIEYQFDDWVKQIAFSTRSSGGGIPTMQWTNISEKKLINPTLELDYDIFVCGDDKESVQVVNTLIDEIKGLRSIYLGPIELSYLAEMSTPLLLNAMIRNKIKNPGIKII